MREKLFLLLSVWTVAFVTILIRPDLITRYLPPPTAPTPGVQNPVAVQPRQEPVIVGEGSATTTMLLENKPTTPPQKTPPPKTLTSVVTTTPLKPAPIVPIVTPTLPQQTAVIPSSTPTAPSLPPIQTVDPQSIVGILCSYTYSFENPITGELVSGETQRKGSGVIIDPEGYLITNRHIVEWDDEAQNVPINGEVHSVTIRYSLNSCKAGQVPKGTVIPTRNEIVTVNPLTQVPVLGYALEPAYINQRPGTTSNEDFFSDFALLRIVGITEDGPTFGINALPASFPAAKLLSVKSLPLANQEVITYGFPGDVSAGRGSGFQTLYLAGSVGKVTKVVEGNQYYARTPLYIETKMEIYAGRSGSPLFWRGYIIGLVMAEEGGNRTNSYSVASDVILKDIQSYLN